MAVVRVYVCARVCVFVRVCVLDSWWLDGVVDKMGPGGVGGGFWISVSALHLMCVQFC